MEAREEFTRLMVWLVQQVDEVDSEQLKADIALLLGAADCVAVDAAHIIDFQRRDFSDPHSSKYAE